MFEHVVLITSLLADRKVREETLPRLVFDERDFAPVRAERRRASRLPRFLRRSE